MGNSDRPLKCLEGQFLISEADLTDPNFFQTVVLMISHNDEGAFGLVVNRRAEANLGDVVEGFEESPAKDIPIYVGGPVQQQFLFVLHTGLPEELRSDHSLIPVEEVVFEPVFQTLEDYLKIEWAALPESLRPKIHLFAGYAGWAPGQLEGELEEGAWTTHPAKAEIVFHPKPEEGWNKALRDKGGIYWVVAETGYKPSIN